MNHHADRQMYIHADDSLPGKRSLEKE